ncbi:choice-of-anchor D domain-containing protein [Hymenobacter antarcticus]|uniref:Por secretion system C-terminal sorting domain-containing protein n=1 Tax=Hymenobacter antarcticus TaxID=486270 RepID=A0ABP7PFC1_9BACT
MHTLYTKGQSFRWVRLLSLLLFLLPLAGRGQSTTVVISQVYAGGGSGAVGTSYARDYVEIFNRSAAAVNIGGYSIQYASATGTVVSGTIAIPTGITLAPGQYYSVLTGTAGTVGAALTTPAVDQVTPLTPTSGSPSVANGGAKIFLANNSTTVTFTAPGTVSANVVDFVGYGTGNTFEGAVAPAPTSTATALLRAGAGCTDTNVNSADFANGTSPAPRNMSTTLAPCGGAATPAEINVKQGTTTYLTGSTYSGFASTTIGSTDVKTFIIENLGGTVLNVSGIAATGDFSVTGTVPATVAANSTATFNVTFTPSVAGTRTGTVTIANDDADEGTYVINLSAQAVAITPNPLIAVSQAGTAYASGSTFPGFASTFVGSTSPAVSFTITNASTTDALTITGITTTGNFAVSGTAPTTVAANGGTATFDLTFTPTAAGARTGTVVIANNSQGTPSYSITLNGTGVTPVPTLTSASPTSLLVGISSPVILTGTNLTGSTVNFNGGTLTPSAVSATSVTVRIVAPSAGAFPVSVTTPGGTSNTVSITATTPPAGFFEPFEAATQSTYVTAASGTAVALTTGSWNLFQGLLLNNDASDKKNNAQSVRLRGGGTLVMNFDKTTGAGVVTVNAALYGTDSGPSFVLEYSTDGGTNYTVTGTPPALTSTLTAYAFTLNVAGNVRLRLSSTNLTAGANPRISIDDLQISDFTAAPCNAPTALAASAVTSNSATVSFTGSASAVNGYTVTTTPVTTTRTLTAAATSVSLSGLTPGTAYTVNIVSNCAAGATSSAASIGFTTLAAAPALTVTQGATPIANGANPSYSFGSQTTGTTQTAVFTLTNSGPDPLTISSVVATNPTVFNFQTFTTPATVAANGGTATITVTYVVGTGPQSGTIGITSDAANGNASFQLNLSGTGVPAAANPLIAVSQAGTAISNGGTYSGFSSPVSTASSPVTFTISNSSTTDALTLGTFVLTGPYFLSGTQPTSVAPSGTATFGLSFLPTAPGTATGSVSIPNNSQSNNPYLINLSGQGTLTNLTVSNAQNVSGTYNNVTVTSTGIATLTSILTVNGTLTVAGVLSGNCQSATSNIKTVDGPGNFVLQAGGRLDICDAAGITASGASGLIQVTGTRSYSSDATYAYLGGQPQVTGNGLPAQVRGLLSGGLNVTLTNPIGVAQQLTLSSGTLATNGLTLTLLSSASGTAVLDHGAGNMVGPLTVQRYISSSNPIGYRHYSTPVITIGLSDLTAPGFTPVYNTTYNTSPTPSTVTPFPTVFGYDQGRIATVTSTYGSFDKGWFSPAANDVMQTGRGYTANAPNAALVDFVGSPITGLVNSGTLSRGADAQAGWQFLGNPYPAPLDWSTVTPAQRPGMDAAMYVFQSSGQYGGGYRSFANGIGASSLIPTAAGYFVRVAAVGTNGSVNLTNANRVTTFGSEPTFGRGTADSRPQLQLQLRGTAAGLDETYVYFEAGATAGRDVEYDATKLANPSGLNVTTLAASHEMAINGLPVLGNSAVLVPLAVSVPQAGTYTFDAANVANFTGTVALIDALTSTRTVLTAGSTYAFTLNGTTAPGRFTLEFRAAGVLANSAAQALAAQIQLFPNPTSGSFRVQLPLLSSKAAVSATLLNALGQTVQTRTLRAPAGQGIDATFDVRGLAAGVYTLRLNVDGTPVVRKVVLE